MRGNGKRGPSALNTVLLRTRRGKDINDISGMSRRSLLHATPPYFDCLRPSEHYCRLPKQMRLPDRPVHLGLILHKSALRQSGNTRSLP